MSGFPAPTDGDRPQPQDQRRGSGRRPVPSPLPLHERTPSENNRLAGIRLVPYSPPRLAAQAEAQDAAHAAAAAAAASPSSSPRRRRSRQRRQARSQSRPRERDAGHHDDDDDNHDSDRTTTTTTSRPTSWGPAAVMTAAATAAARPPGSAGSSSKASSIRTVVGGRPGRARNEDSHAHGATRNENAGTPAWHAKRENKDQEETARYGYEDSYDPYGKLDKAGDATSGPGSALPSPGDSVFPLARGSTNSVSASKRVSLISSSTPAAAAAAAASNDPRLNARVNATSRLLLAHAQKRQQRQPRQQSQSQSQHQSHSQPLPLPLPGSDQNTRSYEYDHRDGSSVSAHNTTFTAPSSSGYRLARSSSRSRGYGGPEWPTSPTSPTLPTSPTSPTSSPYSPQASPSPLSPTYRFSSSHQKPNPPVFTASSPSPSPSLSPSAASVTSVSSSQFAPRPNSRRRNLVALHADKTFSLVPRSTTGRQSPPPVSLTSPSVLFLQAHDNDNDNNPQPSFTSTAADSLKSPPPLSIVTTTVRSSSSHERLSSDVFSSDDRPSSSLTTSATLPDRSTLSPLTSSPGSSTVRLAGDHIAPTDDSVSVSSAATTTTSSSPWNYRLVGGLRKVSKTPNLKKGKERAASSTYSHSYSHSHSRSSSAYSHKHHAVASSLDLFAPLPPLSESSSLTTEASIVANSGTAAALPSTNSSPSSSTASATATARLPQKKPSFASDQSVAAGSVASSSSSLSFSASTVSAATNYKVYAHSSSPSAPVASGSAAAASHTLSDSFGFFSSPSPSTLPNVEILGVSSPAAAPPPHPPLPELRRTNDPDQTFASLASYPSIASFASSETGLSGISNASNAPNVVILGASSPPAPSRYLPHHYPDDTSFAAEPANLDLPSSPPLPPRSANTTTGTFASSDSDQNYVLHGEPSELSLPPPPPSSSSASSSLHLTVSRQPRPTYSQESLIVPPLQPARRKRSNERFGYYKSHSRESLRRAASIKSISSIFGQEAASTFFAGQAFLNLNIPPVPVLKQQQKLAPPGFSTASASSGSLLPKRKPLPLTAASSTKEATALDRTPKTNLLPTSSDSWDFSPSPSSPSSPPPPPRTSSVSPSLPQQPKRAIQMIEEHPHQWSSQLSTVMSESEVESINSRAVSRSVSAVSGAPSGPLARGDASVVSSLSGRRSSTGWAASSTHSRNMPSISDSLALQLDDLRDRQSRSDSLLLDRPQPPYFRNVNSASPATTGSIAPPPPPIRTVRDHDEHGDGLADLHDVLRQPSRSGLSGFFSSTNNSARNLHTSASSRSLASGVFPSWARVYYGSGEHRALSVDPSVSDVAHGDDYARGGAPGMGPGAARPNSAAFRGSPSLENLSFNIFNTRRRPREVQPPGPRPFSNAASMEAGEGSVSGDYYDRIRPQGLRKMTSSLWSPHLRVDRRATRFSVWEPPTVTWSAQTNSLFDLRNLQVIFFTVGFVFPFSWMVASFLPLPLDPQRAMEKRAEGEYGVPAALKQRLAQVDEMRYQSARWWRTLNRVMSVFGLLILGAVVALVIVGVHQGW
ncbi:serine-rich protein [Niveomyces insectorum RCEF 264]|uniref:Serine-rich protein n=1 Tax=Niveomyces insectorum RCEF 264 TaxID=1081102 RepID=A0A167QQX2_9HYPO|nr:serine-rich protein [Niveomyces insectorum RCEF 264]